MVPEISTPGMVTCCLIFIGRLAINSVSLSDSSPWKDIAVTVKFCCVTAVIFVGSALLESVLASTVFPAELIASAIRTNGISFWDFFMNTYGINQVNACVRLYYLSESVRLFFQIFVLCSDIPVWHHRVVNDESQASRHW
jgi:hypothetical protein